MQIRTKLQSRSTKDFDVAIFDDINNLDELLQDVFEVEYKGFKATYKHLEPIGTTGSIRCDVKLTYLNKPFSTVKLEVSDASEEMKNDIDYLQVDSLDYLGLSTPGQVPCLGIKWQIAQKLHACTEKIEGWENDRFRDLIDLQILKELVNPEDLPDIKYACITVFNQRGKHQWVPVVHIYDQWENGYSELAEQINFPVQSLSQAVKNVEKFISEIESSKK